MKAHNIVPTFNKSAKKLVAMLEEAGFRFDRVNSRNVCFYVHEEYPEQRVIPRMTDKELHIGTRNLQRLLGVQTDRDRSKRDAVRVKDRQAKVREQAAAEYARLEQERAFLVAERDDYCRRFGATSVAEANRIAAQLEKNDREMKYWAGLMTESPKGEGHARHRA
ncbi:type II toxin-antitoxin system HicA family toxin [Streptomyces sp. AC495_CC817]|uniref:type II toxin-antitoxin system HicA family toxin n=1 Tax=Streptomyces sp. AC495_CC817 TaxID=2823900 RepID=UPI001C27F3C8|nr:type II toxin-antitoxin system HicA family toxin [Streptomyces sp. AC495_CC817]